MSAASDYTAILSQTGNNVCHPPAESNDDESIEVISEATADPLTNKHGSLLTLPPADGHQCRCSLAVIIHNPAGKDEKL
jgi:hypothetical protein